jgi:hypothetical protein
MRNFPAGKYKHGWMAPEGVNKNLGALNTQISDSSFVFLIMWNIAAIAI